MKLKLALVATVCTAFTALNMNSPEDVKTHRLSHPVRPIETIQPKVDRTELVNALIQVESNGNTNAIGDNGAAVGVLQIQPIMIREVNRILKLKKSDKRFKRKDRFDREKSIEIFTIWAEFHHKDSDYETIARNWNGGPDGFEQACTEKYWKKVQIELNGN